MWKHFENVMALNKCQFLLNCSLKKFPHFLNFHTYPDTSQEQCQWNSAGLSGNYLWKLKGKKASKCAIKSRKNCIKVGVCKYTNTETHIISKYYYLVISKYAHKGKLLDIVFLEIRQGSQKNTGLCLILKS